MITKNENKDEIMRLLKEENRTPKSLSEEYNLPIQTIYTWIRKERINLSKEQKEEEEKMSLFNYRETQLDHIRKQNERIKQLEDKVKYLEDTNRLLTEYMMILKKQLEDK